MELKLSNASIASLKEVDEVLRYAAEQIFQNEVLTGASSEEKTDGFTRVMNEYVNKLPSESNNDKFFKLLLLAYARLGTAVTEDYRSAVKEEA